MKMIKRIVFASILSAFLLTAIACTRTGNNTANDNAGGAGTEVQETTYTGTAEGYGGPVNVSISVGSNGQITGVVAEGQAETPEIGGNAIAAYNEDGFAPIIGSDVAAADVEAVDAVSGATYTSNAVKAALEDALSKVK